jgi:hypothetical protein
MSHVSSRDQTMKRVAADTSRDWLPGQPHREKVHAALDGLKCLPTKA